MIETRQLGRSFKVGFRGRITALHEINLTIQPGEMFGLVGPDGAGKTTLLRMLAGILKPTTGSAMINGYDLNENAESIKQSLGYMPESSGIYPDLTVDENLAFICDIFDIVGNSRKNRVEEFLSFTGLHAFRQRRAGQLSGGMQKKLGLIAALIHKPTLLLLDEPTTGVDPVARREFWDVLTKLQTEGSTVIVSTPYMDEAERCNRIGLLYEGQLMSCDSPTAIKNKLPGRVLALRGKDLRVAQEALHNMTGILDAQTYGDTLNLVVNCALSVENIVQQLHKVGLQHISVRPTLPRLEEVFLFLVRKYADEKTESGDTSI